MAQAWGAGRPPAGVWRETLLVGLPDWKGAAKSVGEHGLGRDSAGQLRPRPWRRAPRASVQECSSSPDPVFPFLS